MSVETPQLLDDSLSAAFLSQFLDYQHPDVSLTKLDPFGELD
jgi:hypothetical protein